MRLWMTVYINEEWCQIDGVWDTYPLALATACDLLRSYEEVSIFSGERRIAHLVRA